MKTLRFYIQYAITVIFTLITFFILGLIFDKNYMDIEQIMLIALIITVEKKFQEMEQKK